MKTMKFLVVAMACLSTGSVCAQHHGHQHQSQDTAAVQQSKASEKGGQTLTVQGACGMCKTRIEKAAKSVDGVSSAQWDSKTKTLQLGYDASYDASKISLDAISKAVANVGHDTDAYKADDKVYAALPGCCKYRK
jgi:Cu(I)/Ag(I) efflux system membrane fusion protein